MSNVPSPLTLYAHAKLNLTCDVLSRRPDGYHELDMLNIRLSLCDELQFTPADQTHITYEGMPAPDNDTVSRAIAAYSLHAGQPVHARVHVLKRIPSEAGLGGGSADAAAVLLALQDAYALLDDAALHLAALQVGADVPYCLHTAPCRVSGIGERIQPLPAPGAPLWFLLLKPAAGISTAALFSSLTLPVSHPRTEDAIRALRHADASALGLLVHNALQSPAQALLPEIGALIRRLNHAGALGACMTGSGSTVFGLYATEAAASAAADGFADVPFVSVCRSFEDRMR